MPTLLQQAVARGAKAVRRINVVIPTLGRPHLLEPLAVNIHETTHVKKKTNTDPNYLQSWSE
jgi:hypothetical protein